MTPFTVDNQALPRINVDQYATNAALVEAVTRHDASWATDQLHRVGTHVSAPEFQHDAELANTYVPKLHQYDRYGSRVDEVEYDESYQRIMAAHLAEGGHGSVARAAVFMMFAQVEPGHACPVSMTHAAVPVIRNSSALADEWIPRPLSRDYDRSWRRASAARPSAWR